MHTGCLKFLSRNTNQTKLIKQKRKTDMPKLSCFLVSHCCSQHLQIVFRKIWSSYNHAAFKISKKAFKNEVLLFAKTSNNAFCKKICAFFEKGYDAFPA
jgi:hypothetical protein